MIEEIVINFTKHICQYLYQNDKDDRFRYWVGLPDWDSYLSFLSDPKNIDKENSFGGILIDRGNSASKWGLASKTNEYHVTVYLMRELEPGSERKLQKDLIHILDILRKHSTLIRDEIYFDKSDLSGLVRRAKIRGLACGELKVSLLVDQE